MLIIGLVQHIIVAKGESSEKKKLGPKDMEGLMFCFCVWFSMLLFLGRMFVASVRRYLAINKEFIQNHCDFKD